MAIPTTVASSSQQHLPKNSIILKGEDVAKLMIAVSNSESETNNRRNALVMKQVNNLFDQGHRCVVIKGGSPFTYKYCGKKGKKCEAL